MKRIILNNGQLKHGLKYLFHFKKDGLFYLEAKIYEEVILCFKNKTVEIKAIIVEINRENNNGRWTSYFVVCPNIDKYSKQFEVKNLYGCDNPLTFQNYSHNQRFFKPK